MLPIFFHINLTLQEMSTQNPDFVLNFEVSTEILFGDGFELGDTSAWTEDLPEGTGSFASAVESPMIG